MSKLFLIFGESLFALFLKIFGVLVLYTLLHQLRKTAVATAPCISIKQSFCLVYELCTLSSCRYQEILCLFNDLLYIAALDHNN